MRVLERKADIETGYSGGFVQSIDGIEENEGSGNSPEDWFFYVNGVESGVGAAQYPLHGGESIWWDYHDWGAAIHIPAVVGSFPEPFLDGYEGDQHPVAVVCEAAGAACATVRERLEDEGVTVSSKPSDDAIRVLVGTWDRLRDDQAAAQIERGPGQSGVYAEPAASGCGISALDTAGDTFRRYGAGAGLIAATRRYEAPPTWVVTGCDAAGVGRAAGLLDARDLDGRFAVIAAPDGSAMPVPLPVTDQSGG